MAENATPSENASSDYSGGNQFNSVEELEAYLKGSTAPDDGTPGDKTGEEGKQKDKTTPPATGAPASETPPAKEKKEGEEGNEDEGKEHKSIVHYLNDEFKLNLPGIDKLPEEFSPAEEAEMVAEIFRRVQVGINSKLAEYKEIDTVLQDEEVKNFVKAKLEGKTLKDYVQEYAVSTQGLPSEAIASKYLKSTNPSATDEDIKELINTYREKGKLEKLETDARKYFQTKDAADAQLKEAKTKADADEARVAREQDLLSFRQFLGAVKEVAPGVPVDDKMKKEVFTAATQIVDQKSGMTWLDRALLTDKGVFLATMGILHLEKLLNGKQTTEVNKRNARLANTLFDTPDKLQSGSSAGGEKDFDASIANQF